MIAVDKVGAYSTKETAGEGVALGQGRLAVRLFDSLERPSPCPLAHPGDLAVQSQSVKHIDNSCGIKVKLCR